MAERRRRLRADDTDLWRRAMRDVAPMPGRPPQPPPPPVPRSDPPPPPSSAIPPPPRRHAALPPLAHSAGVDRSTAERLKRGRMAIEARLDLHGMTQAEAHRALAAFVYRARAGGRRCVLVITGRGLAGGGVLRSAVPRWLDEPELRRHILTLAPAQPCDGGSGAIYVLIRRTAREAGLAEKPAFP
jgi:DNA-nicking Smr family endonuclease